MKENLSMLALVAAVEKYGPMTTRQLTEFIPRCESAIYRQGMLAKKEAFVSVRKIANGKVKGRHTVKFYRTEKPCEFPPDVLALMRPIRVDIKPFRDPLTAAFYGEYRRAA